jgi:hypothetical protein
MLNKTAKLFIGSSLILSSIGLIFSEPNPAIASSTTNQNWKKYMSGRQVIDFYSSSNSPQGFTSLNSLHFCSNGELAYGYSNFNVSKNGGTKLIGYWKIHQSNGSQSVIQITNTKGKKILFQVSLDMDGRLNTTNGNRLSTEASDFCQ